jgi:N-acetylneuraminic acid mutarotase
MSPLDLSATCVQPPSGLVSWWQAEGDSSDAMGNNPGALVNGTSFAPGMVGLAFSFDQSSSQSVQIPYSTSLLTPAFTWEAWIYPTDFDLIDAQAWVFGQAYGRQLVMQAGPGGGLRVAIYITDTYGDFFGFPGPYDLAPLEWAHIAATWDGTSILKLYINGSLVAQGTEYVSLPLGDAGCGFSIGGINDSCGYFGQYFPGLIDELSVYDRPLSDGEIAAIYQAGSAGKCRQSNSGGLCAPCPNNAVSWWAGEGNASDSLGVNPGTPQNGPTYTAGEVGEAFNFNGVSQAVQIPYSASLISNSFSVEAWINPAGQPAGQAFILGQSYGRQLIVRPGSPGLNVAFDVCTDPYYWYEVADNSGAVPVGQWTHLAGVCDTTAATLTLYINGALDRQAPLSITPYDSGCAFTIGGVNNACGYYGQYFDGQIDEVTLYGSALSAEEVMALYNAGSGGKCWPPPTIVTQPTNQTAAVGATVQFSVVAGGIGPFSYQWYLNDAALSDGGGVSGSQTATLVLSNVQESQAGTYYVVVSNSGGAYALSWPAALSLDSLAGMWVYTGSLNSQRESHASALLTNGQVLVAGGGNGAGPLSGAELYDPNNGTWTVTGPLSNPRTWGIATRLTNGLVLLAGGTNASGVLASAELYNPATGSWTPTGSMGSPRLWFTATLLTNGQVLVAGGTNATGVLANAELYDPISGMWTSTGSLNTGRKAHTGTLLSNGQVLVAGGDYSGGYAVAGEVYDPVTGAWTLIGSLHEGRRFHTATLLADGEVLVAGGENAGGALQSAELYNPISRSWAVTGPLDYPRRLHVAARLASGQVLVAGGDDGAGNAYASAELYDWSTGTWRMTGAMNQPRAYTTLTVLTNGQVLAAGGHGPLPSAEIYTPSSAPAPVILTQPQSQTNCPGSTVTFEVLAEGEEPLSYRWLKNGAALADGGIISGAGTATLTLTGVSPADAASYSVVVGNDGGATNSAVGASTIVATPVITTQPASQAAWSGAFVLFSVEFSGAESATYQWYFGGSALSDGPIVSGSRTDKLLLRGVQQSQAGSYYVVVTTCGGSATSSTATLSVSDFPPGPWPLPWPGPAPGPAPVAGTWESTGSMPYPAELHSATLLDDGKVLVVFAPLSFCDWICAGDGCGWGEWDGGAELYDPVSGSWSFPAHQPSSPGFGNSATLLPSGQVLVAGGGGGPVDDCGLPLSGAQTYNPAGQSWASTSSMKASHCFHTATLLGDGQVLVAGGCGGDSDSWDSTAAAELFDPGDGSWTATQTTMQTPRACHTATLLPNGKVLVAGGGGPPWRHDGCGASASTPSAELYDPATGTWAGANALHEARCGHTAILLNTGKVLVAGGYNGSAAVATAELYDPVAGTWACTGSLNYARAWHVAAKLPSGKVLVAGGINGSGALDSAELYDPDTGSWGVAAAMNQARSFATITLLNNGKVLVAGGSVTLLGNCSSTAEIYSPPPSLVPFGIWITEPKANGNLP